MKVVIAGGGAAGFFAAITCAENFPECEVLLLEKSDKLLSKVKVSGGGRCNVTNFCFDTKILVTNYPRGQKALMGPFSRFQPRDTVNWFESHGVTLKTEEDGRMFPETNNSQTIVDCLMDAANNARVKIWKNTGIKTIQKEKEAFKLGLENGNELTCDRILIATGGHPKASAYTWLQDLGHAIVPPVPSLFTFNIQDKELHQLAGVSLENASVSITGTKFRQVGPLLITHWGLSGPAILKLSAVGARALNELQYEFQAVVNWMPEWKEVSMLEKLLNLKAIEAKKQMHTFSPFHLPLRLWKYLLTRSNINTELRWADLSKKSLNILVNILLGTPFAVKGKTTFKEEFVTCGGVLLENVNLKTMESIKCPGMYFAGEVLDVDGVTGGFNFQNAWTTGWIAGMAIGESK
jgi:predicted Rossmann fold flavoprotein